MNKVYSRESVQELEPSSNRKSEMKKACECDNQQIISYGCWLLAEREIVL